MDKLMLTWITTWINLFPYAKGKKLITKAAILNDSIYMKHPDRQAYTDRKQMHVCLKILRGKGLGVN